MKEHTGQSSKGLRQVAGALRCIGERGGGDGVVMGAKDFVSYLHGQVNALALCNWLKSPRAILRLTWQTDLAEPATASKRATHTRVAALPANP